MGWLLFGIFIVVPIIEIALFIALGDLIGLWWTLGFVVLTAIVGSVLIRIQGFAVLQQARVSASRAELPVDALIHGVGLLIAGLVLITPGFFTDAVGFTLLVPPLRLAIGRAVMAFAKSRVQVVAMDLGGRAGSDGMPPKGPDETRAADPPPRRAPDGSLIIEGEAEDITKQ
ncbi:MAG: FxsA family protein [Pseudomonadota bacterium]